MRTLSATLTTNQQNMKSAIMKMVLSKSGQATRTYDITSSTDRILKLAHTEQPYSQVAEVTVQNPSSNLTSLDLRGYKGVISYGYNDATNGDEYSATAPLWCVSQRLDSWRGGLACVFQLIGTPNRLDRDRASEAFTPNITDLQTVKSLLRQIAAGGWSAWQASTAYSLDDFIIPTTSNGLVYKCTTAGTSDSSEPTWATTEGNTTSDNTATWTCEGVEIKSFNHTTAYTITFDSEDAIIDSYKPKDTFRILLNDSRLDIIKRLISYTKQAFRVEDDEELHVFLPVTTPLIVNADMELTTGWTGGGRNTTQPYSGTYSWRISNAGAPNEAYQDLTWSNAYRGKKITFEGQAYIPSVNHARLRLDDAVGTTDGSYHTGVAGHELLTVTRTFDAAATRLRITMRNENNSSAAYFDDVTVAIEYDYEYKLLTSGEHTFFDKSHRKRLLIPAKITVSSHPDHPTIYTGTATDSDSNDLLSHPEYHYARLASNAEALAMAEAIRDRYLWDGEQGSGLVPMNCGQEVFDYVKFTDSRDNSDTRIGNVGYLKRTYVPGKFEMELRFGSTAFGFGDVSLPRGVGAGTRPASGDTDEVWNTLRKTWDFLERIVEKVERLAEYRQDEFAWMLPVSSQPFVANIDFTATDDDDITWTAGTVKLADGRSQAIDSGSLNLTATHYMYVVWGNRVLQNTTTYSTAIGSDKVLIGIATKATTTHQKAYIMMPQSADNVLINLDKLGDSSEAYGDGDDGDVTISSNTTLSRDMFYDNLTVDSGKTLTTAGYRVYCKTKLTNNGTIEWNGNDAGAASGLTGGTAGGALSAGALGGSAAGSAGANGVNDDSNGDNGTAGNGITSSEGGAGAAGGAGGRGRQDSGSTNYTGGTAGSAGSVTAPAADRGGFRSLPFALILKEIESTVVKIGGGAGGGGGGSGGAGGAGTPSAVSWGAGGGGGGGGVICIAAKEIDNENGTISANGGAGSNGLQGTVFPPSDSGTGGSGGGGGGGGGFLMLLYNKATFGTESANGGDGGDGGAPNTYGGGIATAGSAGSSGSAGAVIKITNI